MLKILLLIGLLPMLAVAESLTNANIKGQKYLLENGWYVITSPKEAWEFARQNSESSRSALLKALETAQIEAGSSSLKQNLSSAIASMKTVKEVGDRSDKTISELAKTLAKKNVSFARSNLKDAWLRINLGYLQYSRTNADDLNALKAINRSILNRQMEHFNSLNEVVEPLFETFLEKSEINWQKHFKDGVYAFEEQYQNSGTRGNSVLGLWDVIKGHFSFIYHSLVKPSGKALKKAGQNSSYYATQAVLHSFITAHNVIYSTGANLYYSTKLGYKVLAPSVEAGFLSGLALINVASAPVVWGALETAGTITKVATTTSAPLIGASQFVIAQTADTAQKAAVYLYHGGRGVAQVGLESVESGVVLGYSALSQIPPQLLLTSINSAIFLVYDGPRLILAKASGKINGEDISSLPTGSVMNMQELKKHEIDIVPISNDEFLLKKVLQYAQ